MSSYGDPEYWDARYSEQEGQRFDWLEDYQTLKSLLVQYMPRGKDTKILNIGCGNGEIQDRLYQEGYHNITNNDISTVVIKQMKRTSKHTQMLYEVMDVCDMKYKDNMFDIIVDKSTIDALLCSDNPLVNVAKMMYHIHRTLVDGGFYFVVSYGNPANRLIHMSRRHVNFNIKTLQIEGRNGTTHFVYICQKVPMTVSEQVYRQVLMEVKEEQTKLLDEGLDPQHGIQSDQLFGDNQKEMFGI